MTEILKLSKERSMNMLFAKKIRNYIYEKFGIWVSRGKNSGIPLELKYLKSQYMADLVRTALIFSGKKIGILQIGAHDGRSFDPIFDVVNGKDVSLHLVEPNHDSIEMLRRNYSANDDINIYPFAIGSMVGQTPVYKFSQKIVEIYPDFGGTTSLLKSHLLEAYERNKFRFPNVACIEDEILCSTIKIINGESLMNMIGVRPIDILVIDVEGYDYIVLQQILSSIKSLPKIIHFESRFLKPHEYEAALLMLRNFGYELRSLINDTVAIKNAGI